MGCCVDGFLSLSLSILFQVLLESKAKWSQPPAVHNMRSGDGQCAFAMLPFGLRVRGVYFTFDKHTISSLGSLTTTHVQQIKI